MGWSEHRDASEFDPAREPCSDARPAADHPRYAELDPDADRNSRMRRRLVQLLLVTVFITGSGASLFGERGMLDRSRLSKQRANLEAQVVDQRARVEGLRSEVRGLHEDPLSRERIAREQLGFVRPGEILFLLPEEGSGRESSDVPSRP